MARFTLLALAAATEAIQDSGLDPEANAKTTGVILSSGIGGLPTIEEQHTRGEEKGMEKVSPYFVPMSIANMAAAQVAIRFGLKGMCTCPVTACAGGTNAVGDAFHRIRDATRTPWSAAVPRAASAAGHRRLYQHEGPFHRHRPDAGQPAL